jgi:hypothetical protein
MTMTLTVLDPAAGALELEVGFVVEVLPDDEFDDLLPELLHALATTTTAAVAMATPANFLRRASQPDASDARS